MAATFQDNHHGKFVFVLELQIFNKHRGKLKMAAIFQNVCQGKCIFALNL